MSEPRALMLSPELPYPLQGGGALRTASLLNYLARHHTVDLILFRHLDSQQPAESLPPHLADRVLILELPRHSRTRLRRALRNTSRLVRGVPPLLDRFQGFAAPISQFIANHRYRVAVIEHFWCAPYQQTLRPHADSLVLDLHNIESKLHWTEANSAATLPERLAHRHFARLYRKLEANWIPSYDEVLTASALDCSRIHPLAKSATVFPNSVPWRKLPDVPEEEAIAFSGNFDYHPNQTAVAWFAQHAWPKLAAAHPNLKWRLIGMNPESIHRTVAHLPRVELTGPVSDAVDELARAKVVVVPLLSGSGTRLKIVEAWAAGRAVIATPLGAEGFPTDSLLVAPLDRFTQAVEDVLTDPTLRAHLATKGRTCYEQSLTWDAAWNTLSHSRITP